MIKIIACVGKNLELGLRNDLCFHIKEDMKFFRGETLNKKVIMGLNTFRSLGNRPLKNRENYVLSFEKGDLPNSVSLVTNFDEFMRNFPKDDELFVIGGASVYNQSLKYADELILTEVDSSAEADVFFPSFDKTRYNKTIIKTGSENGINYSFCRYKLKEEK